MTPDEQSVLDSVARTEGADYAERWAESILAQARALGEIDPESATGRMTEEEG